MFNKDVALKMSHCKLYCRVEIVKMTVFWILRPSQSDDGAVAVDLA
jgi:hypothetical protein